MSGLISDTPHGSGGFVVTALYPNTIENNATHIAKATAIASAAFI
jgi:hypothetical protein